MSYKKGLQVGFGPNIYIFLEFEYGSLNLSSSMGNVPLFY